jgi:hypothetical protein
LERINLVWIGGDLDFPCNDSDEPHRNLGDGPITSLVVDLKQPVNTVAQLERKISSYMFDETVPADSIHGKPQLTLEGLGAEGDTTQESRSFLLEKWQWQMAV